MLKNFGIGIDIIEINRFREKPFENNEKFYRKIFTESEIHYCLKRRNSAQTFASKFAVKEAVTKALTRKIDFLEIVTDYHNLKPVVKLQNDETYNFLVSTSHEKLYAIAIVISEKISNKYSGNFC